MKKTSGQAWFYPYLLKGVSIDAPDMAWCMDILYIRLAHGFVYLVAVMDWNSRNVLSWELSRTLDTGFYLDAVRQALQISIPKIFNTDQGSQFTSTDFTRLLEKQDIKVSMDGAAGCSTTSSSSGCGAR